MKFGAPSYRTGRSWRRLVCLASELIPEIWTFLQNFWDAGSKAEKVAAGVWVLSMERDSLHSMGLNLCQKVSEDMRASVERSSLVVGETGLRGSLLRSG